MGAFRPLPKWVPVSRGRYELNLIGATAWVERDGDRWSPGWAHGEREEVFGAVFDLNEAQEIAAWVTWCILGSAIHGATEARKQIEQIHPELLSQGWDR